MRSLLLAVAAFAAMEPVTAATHRFVMHGIGARLHRSHHRRRPLGRWEANDAYPVMFAAVVCIGLWLGFNQPGWGELVPVGVGITAYGAAYALVHDVYIHRRLHPFPRVWTRRSEVDDPVRHAGASRRFGGRVVNGLFDHLAEAHALHHRFGGAPYGMLVPIVPASLRRRTADPSVVQRIPAAPRA